MNVQQMHRSRVGSVAVEVWFEAKQCRNGSPGNFLKKKFGQVEQRATKLTQSAVANHLKPLFLDPGFWLVCVLAFTLVETSIGKDDAARKCSFSAVRWAFCSAFRLSQ
jgi:hypothetical protein